MASASTRGTHQDDSDASRDVALFRHNVIADLLRLPAGSRWSGDERRFLPSG